VKGNRRKIIILLICGSTAIIVGAYFYLDWSERNSRGMPPALLCRSQLREIQAAKDEWGILKNKTTNDAPTWDDIRPYLHRETPLCPSGGTYILGKIGEPVKCSYPGHTLE
jgi:hypothetical protein